MNLFADLLAASTKAQAKEAAPVVTATGPRIQKSRRGVEIKSAREIATMRQADRHIGIAAAQDRTCRRQRDHSSSLGIQGIER